MFLALISGQDRSTIRNWQFSYTCLKQGHIDRKALLGHALDEMAALYADSRGLPPVRVQIDAA